MGRKIRQMIAILSMLSMLLGILGGCTGTVEETLDNTERQITSETPPEESVTDKGEESVTDEEEESVTDEEGESATDEQPESEPNAEVDSADVSTERQLYKDTIYNKERVTEVIELFGWSYVRNVWVTEDKLYFWVTVERGTDQIFSCNPDFTDIKAISAAYQSDNVDDVAVSKSGEIYLLQSTQHNWSSVDRYETWKLCRRGESDDSAWAVTLDVDWYRVWDLFSVGERIVVSSGDGLLIYNQKGELERIYKPWDDEEATYSWPIVVLDDSRILLVFGGAYGNYLREVNLDTDEIIDYQRPYWWESEFSCQRGCGYDVMIRLESGLVGYNLGDAMYTEVLDCMASKVSNTYGTEVALYVLDDERILSVNESIGQEMNRQRAIYVLQKAEPETIEDRIVITLGGFYLLRKVEGPGINLILDAVEQFNESNDTYYVKLDNRYFFYGGVDEWREKKLDALVVDIKNGTAPDIILLEDGYISLTSGIEPFMEDLYPWIDQDKELERSDFFENMLKAYSLNGRLCQITPSVEIETMAARRSVVGDVQSWNMEELENLMSAYPELVPGSDTQENPYTNYDVEAKISYLREMVRLSGEQFIDLEKQRCSFDSEEFIAWLKLCGEETVVRKTAAENSASGEAQKWIFGSRTIAAVTDVNYQDTDPEDGIVYVGAPGPEGYGSVITGILPMGILAESQVKDGAWEFIRFILSKEYQDDIKYSIPIRRDCVEEQMEAAQMEETSSLMQLLETVERNIYCTYGLDLDLIVAKESRKYFEGKVTAEAAAKLIQDGIEAYLNFDGKSSAEPPSPSENNDDRQNVGNVLTRRFAFGSEVIADLDGDGTEERLTVAVETDEVSGNDMPAVRINELTFNGEVVCSLIGDLENLDTEFYYLTDLDTKDNWMEIALFEKGMSDDPETFFLRYRQGKLICIGKVETGAPLLDDGNGKLIMAGDGRLVGKSRLDIVEKAWAVKTWNLENNADGSAVITAEVPEWYRFYPHRAAEEYPELIQDMTVYTKMDENSETIVLPAGTRLDVFGYYPEGEWLYIPYIGGHRVWLKVSEDDLLMPMEISVEEIGEYIEGLRDVE